MHQVIFLQQARKTTQIMYTQLLNRTVISQNNNRIIKLQIRNHMKNYDNKIADSAKQSIRYRTKR